MPDLISLILKPKNIFPETLECPKVYAVDVWGSSEIPKTCRTMIERHWSIYWPAFRQATHTHTMVLLLICKLLSQYQCFVSSPDVIVSLTGKWATKYARFPSSRVFAVGFHCRLFVCKHLRLWPGLNKVKDSETDDSHCFLTHDSLFVSWTLSFENLPNMLARSFEYLASFLTANIAAGKMPLTTC